MAIQNPAIGAAPEGRTTALGMSTLAFTVCFAVWTIFSIIGVQIKKDLGLSDTQFGLLVGTPILTGSLIRLLLGVWTVYPVVKAVQLGHLRCDSTGQRCRNAGWGQYSDAFLSHEFQQALLVSVKLALMTVPTGTSRMSAASL